MYLLMAKVGIPSKMVDLYLYMLRNPNSSLVELSLKLKISRTSLYNYLSSLKEKGLAYKLPNSNWKAIDPEVVIKNFNLDLKYLSSSLLKLKQVIFQSNKFQFLDSNLALYKSLATKLSSGKSEIFFVGNQNSQAKLLPRLKSKNALTHNPQNQFVNWWIRYISFANLLIVDHSLYLLFDDGPTLLIEDKKITQSILIHF